MEGTNGARIPPTLHDMEQTPKPAFLKQTHKKIIKKRIQYDVCVSNSTCVFSSPDNCWVEFRGVDVGDVERRADHQFSQKSQRRDAQHRPCKQKLNGHMI